MLTYLPQIIFLFLVGAELHKASTKYGEIYHSETPIKSNSITWGTHLILYYFSGMFNIFTLADFVVISAMGLSMIQSFIESAEIEASGEYPVNKYDAYSLILPLIIWNTLLYFAGFYDSIITNMIN